MALYVQAGHPTGKVRLTDDDYWRKNRSSVRYCHDALVIGPDRRFYLPSRKKGKALAGPWFFGGEVVIWTPVPLSLVETLEREMSLEIAPERFVWVEQNRFFLNGEEAQDAIQELYRLHLSDEEIARVVPNPTEYESGPLKPYGQKEIEEIENPFVRNIISALWDKKHNWWPPL